MPPTVRLGCGRGIVRAPHEAAGAGQRRGVHGAAAVCLELSGGEGGEHQHLLRGPGGQDQAGGRGAGQRSVVFFILLLLVLAALPVLTRKAGWGCLGFSPPSFLSPLLFLCQILLLCLSSQILLPISANSFIVDLVLILYTVNFTPSPPSPPPPPPHPPPQLPNCKSSSILVLSLRNAALYIYIDSHCW